MAMLPLPKPNPNPCSISLQPKMKLLLPMRSLVSVGTGKHASVYIAATSTPNATYQTKNPAFFFNNINNNPFVRESSSRPGKLVADQILTTRDVDVGVNTKQKDCESIEKEVETTICRLKAVVERIRESEVDKVIMGRFKGTMSDQDQIALLVENTSREILLKLLERPVSYLKSGVNIADFEEKLKDVNLLILMLEKSSLGCQR